MRLLKSRRITRREIILLTVAAAVLAAGMAQSFIRNLRADIKRLDEQISAQENRLFKLKRIVMQEPSFDEPYAHGTESLLGRIGEIAQENEFGILTMKPSAPRDETGYRTLSIDIEAQDDVAALAGFLYHLTSELKQVGIEKLRITAADRRGIPAVSIRLAAIAFKP